MVQLRIVPTRFFARLINTILPHKYEFAIPKYKLYTPHLKVSTVDLNHAQGESFRYVAVYFQIVRA